jgi:hypothetical protein
MTAEFEMPGPLKTGRTIGISAPVEPARKTAGARKIVLTRVRLVMKILVSAGLFLFFALVAVVL